MYKKNCLISIIIPVYNVEEYIEECIQSVFAQTYPNLECIIVDDCTPDNSISIIEEILSKYEGSIFFKILHHDQNQGLSAARNTGIREAKGDYVFFLDSDDYLINDTISVLAAKLKEYPSSDMVIGSYVAKNSFIADNDIVFVGSNFNYRQMVLTNKIPITLWNRLISLELIKNYNLFFKQGILFEDNFWSLYSLYYVKNITLTNAQTYFYRYNPNGIMNSPLKRFQRFEMRTQLISYSLQLCQAPLISLYRLNILYYILANECDISIDKSTLSNKSIKDYYALRKEYRTLAHNRMSILEFALRFIVHWPFSILLKFGFIKRKTFSLDFLMFKKQAARTILYD